MYSLQKNKDVDRQAPPCLGTEVPHRCRFRLTQVERKGAPGPRLGAWALRSLGCANLVGLAPRQTNSPCCPKLEEGSQKALDARSLRDRTDASRIPPSRRPPSAGATRAAATAAVGPEGKGKALARSSWGPLHLISVTEGCQFWEAEYKVAGELAKQCP